MEVVYTEETQTTRLNRHVRFAPTVKCTLGDVRALASKLAPPERQMVRIYGGANTQILALMVR